MQLLQLLLKRVQRTGQNILWSHFHYTNVEEGSHIINLQLYLDPGSNTKYHIAVTSIFTSLVSWDVTRPLENNFSFHIDNDYVYMFLYHPHKLFNT